MNSVNSVEAGIETVLSVIQINREKYEEHIVECTRIVIIKRQKVPHLIHESLFVEKEGGGTRYIMFGADKYGVSDILKLFDILDIDLSFTVPAVPLRSVFIEAETSNRFGVRPINQEFHSFSTC